MACVTLLCRPSIVHRAVIVSNLFYASSAWRGFSTAAARQRMSAFLHRGVRDGLHGADDPSVTQIVDDADDKLFRSILSNPHHTLHHILPEQTTHEHQLRTRRHDRQLVCKSKFDDSIILSPDCLKTVINHTSFHFISFKF